MSESIEERPDYENIKAQLRYEIAKRKDIEQRLIRRMEDLEGTLLGKKG